MSRQTGKHNSVLMLMPTGTMIAVGKEKSLRDKIMAPALHQLFDEVRRARLEPMLFLAVLDLVGSASWSRRPAEVANLHVYLKSVEPGWLTTHEGWKKILKAYSDHASKSVKAGKGKASTKEDPRIVDGRLYPYDSTYVTGLTGLKGEELSQAGLRLSVWMNRGPVGREFLDKKLAIRVQTGKVKKNYFSDEGAFAMAQQLLQHIRPDLLESAPAVDPGSNGVSDKKPDEKKGLATGAQYGNLEALTASQPSAGACLLQLCKKFGVEEQWDEQDPFRLDSARTIQALYAKIGK